MSKRLNTAVECVRDVRNTTGESPLWSARERALYWVDIPAGRIFRWQPEKRRFRLESVHPGHTASAVREATGFDYDVGDVQETAAPSAAELDLLRGPVAAHIAADYPDFAKRVWS